MRIVFFGDGIWATQCLRRLLDDGHRVAAVVLRRQPTDPTLAELAQDLNISVHNPARVNDPGFVSLVASLRPELNVSMSYDQILRRPILQSAPLGVINCHAGMLPYYRGRNVINWAIINNERELGLTIHYMDEGIDKGDIILQDPLPIAWDDTYGSVLAKVQQAFPDLLAEAVALIENQQVLRRPQAHMEGTYVCRRVSGDERIDWQDTSLNIYNKIRAITQPGPGARTLLDQRILIIWSAWYDPSWPKYIATPGEVVGVVSGQGVKIKTGDSTLILRAVQFEGEDGPAVRPKFPIGTRLGISYDVALRKLSQEVARLSETVEHLQDRLSLSGGVANRRLACRGQGGCRRGKRCPGSRGSCGCSSP